MKNIENESYREVLSGWSMYVQARGFKPSTMQNHITCIQEFLAWLEEQCIYQLRDITSQDIWKHWEYLQTRPNQRRSGGVSSSVLNFHVYSLRTFFGWLENMGVISINPFSGLEFSRQYQAPRIALGEEEVKKLYSECETPKEKAILTVFYALGLRRSEAEALNISDIDFAQQKVIVKEGKFGKRRELPLHPSAERMFREYITTSRREIIMSQTPKDHQALFYSAIGTRMKGDKMNKCIKRLGKRAKLQRTVTPHILRHSVATHLMENGMPLEMIKDYLGHSTMDTTQNYIRGYGWKWNQSKRSKN